MTPGVRPSPRSAGATAVPVVVGAGLAGLVTALRLAPQPVVVLAAGRLGQGAASGWAQGGIAAALADDDSPDLHAEDTLAAGAGLCERDVVARITAAAPCAVAYLADLGARFDRDLDGGYRLGLEGAHSRRRIVHAAGDGTGAEILRAVVAAVRRSPSITVLEGTRARRILVEEGRVAGLVVEAAPATAGAMSESDLHSDGPGSGSGHGWFHITTDRVVLATGGSGQLWQHTTNPSGSRGHGLALAARAGAHLRDLEMVQFHPTALDVGLDPMPLVSEAVRGAGALLVDGAGRPLTDEPLAARDVVARAVSAELSRGGRVFLDARHTLGAGFAEAFPTVARACAAAGIDPATDLIPVRPAAHYQCGGVTVDLRGRSTLPGLWAVGEVASTGLHGANRLASNSLLEAVVCGGWAAEDLAEELGGQRLSEEPPTALLPGETVWSERDDPSRLGAVRTVMSQAVGILRDGPGLEAAEAALRAAVAKSTRPAESPTSAARSVPVCAVDDASLVALLVIRCARQREESRGGHARLDFPCTANEAVHTGVTLDDVLPGGQDEWDRALTRLREAHRRVSTPSLAATIPTDITLEGRPR